jgi:hypothetical protein
MLLRDLVSELKVLSDDVRPLSHFDSPPLPRVLSLYVHFSCLFTCYLGSHAQQDLNSGGMVTVQREGFASALLPSVANHPIDQSRWRFDVWIGRACEVTLSSACIHKLSRAHGAGALYLASCGEIARRHTDTGGRAGSTEARIARTASLLLQLPEQSSDKPLSAMLREFCNSSLASKVAAPEVYAGRGYASAPEVRLQPVAEAATDGSSLAILVEMHGEAQPESRTDVNPVLRSKRAGDTQQPMRAPAEQPPRYFPVDSVEHSGTSADAALTATGGHDDDRYQAALRIQRRVRGQSARREVAHRQRPRNAEGPVPTTLHTQGQQPQIVEPRMSAFLSASVSAAGDDALPAVTPLDAHSNGSEAPRRSGSGNANEERRQAALRIQRRVRGQAGRREVAGRRRQHRRTRPAQPATQPPPLPPQHLRLDMESVM